MAALKVLAGAALLLGAAAQAVRSAPPAGGMLSTLHRGPGEQSAASPSPPAAPTGKPDPADPVARWHADIAEASARFGIPAPWIERVIRAESGGHPTLGGRPIISRAGAMGLMQLMPATWAAMREENDLGLDPYNPHDNILAGAAYLAAMYRRFGYPGLFAAYNAGPRRYADALAGRTKLPQETLSYLEKVTGAQANGGTREDQVPPPLSLFVVVEQGSGQARTGGRSAPAEADPQVRPDPMFAIRKSP